VIMITKIKQKVRSFECRERFGEFFVLEDKGYQDIDGNWEKNYDVIAYCRTEANAQLVIKGITKVIDEETKQEG
jgi:hypothetical protein